MLQVNGSGERPRLAVYRSNNHIYAQVGAVHCTVALCLAHCMAANVLTTCAMHSDTMCTRPQQVIDDTAGNTLVAASTLTPDVRSQLNGTGTGGNQACWHPTALPIGSPFFEPMQRCKHQGLLQLITTWSKSASASDLKHPAHVGPCCHLQDAAQLVGRKIAELCLSKSIEKVAFDRGGHVYHGRIKVGLILQRLLMPLGSVVALTFPTC